MTQQLKKFRPLNHVSGAWGSFALQTAPGLGTNEAVISTCHYAGGHSRVGKDWEVSPSFYVPEKNKVYLHFKGTRFRINTENKSVWAPRDRAATVRPSHTGACPPGDVSRQLCGHRG